jgi:hypothetical protein
MIDPLQKIVAVGALLAIVFTILLTPIFSALFRRRITWLMRQSSGTEAVISTIGDASTAARRPPPLLFDLTDQPAGRTQPVSPLGQVAKRARRALMIAYCLAGIAHLAVLAVAFLISKADILARAGDFARTAMIGIALLVLALPTVLAIIHLAAASRLRQLVIVVGTAIVIYVLLGNFQGLATAVFELHLVVPIAVYFLFNLRFWRGIAPLVFLIMAAASFGWLIGVTVWTGLELDEDWLLIPRVVGFAAGAGIGFLLLRRLGRHYQAGGISDQEIFLDAWYLIFTVIQTVIFVLTSRNALFVATLLAFPLYLLVKRISLRLLLPKATQAPPRLLLLRVFGHGRRTERLFDEFTLPWRAVGSIELIAGSDLALRNVEPSDFAAFLSGTLAARYISDTSGIDTGAPPLPETAAPDGRYPLRQFYCLADTWLSVLRSRVKQCDAVVMDLRGFTEERHGCRDELAHLATTYPDKPVVLIVDDKTDMALLAQIVGTPVKSPLLAAGPAWLLLSDRVRGSINGSRVFQCVAERL